MKRSAIATIALAGVGAAIAGGSILLNRTKSKNHKDYDLKDKTVLIAGGSHGLGLSLAREFALAGSNVIICARETDELDQAKRRLNDMGIDMTTVQCDITHQIETDATMQAIQSAHNPIDILVNNAGAIHLGPSETMTKEDYQEAMDTHFKGAFNTTEAVLSEMKERKEGRILNIASVGGKIPAPHLTPYTASQFALVGYSEAMRIELAEYGIIVTTVCPGFMRTSSLENAHFKGQNNKEYSWSPIAGTVPGISMDIDQAAKQIVAACRNGDADIILRRPITNMQPECSIDFVTS